MSRTEIAAAQWAQKISAAWGEAKAARRELNSLRAKQRAADRRLSARRQVAQVVYFVEAEGMGLVKIGTSSDMHLRLCSIRSHSPAPIRFLKAIAGDAALEAALHNRFSRLRVRGEWFRAEPELMAFIEGGVSAWVP